MVLSLLLLLLICSTQATHFYGTVMTYYPKTTNANGSVEVVLRYKLNFHSCADSDTWICSSGNCGTQSSLVLNIVDRENSGTTQGEWCQREGIMTRQVPTNAPFELRISSGNWITGIRNGISRWRAVTLVDLRNRSDTGRANTSPQTTILPAVRVPSNCQRDFNLLAFDPDGDEVKCRYGNTSLLECDPCTPPSVLTLSPSCTLSFSPTNSNNEGPYAVQLVMEDFPRQTITLTQTNGTQTTITTNDAISKLPVQFVLRVDPVVPSCTEGLYLPKFLPPTPANRARLYTPVNQTLEISISAEANNSAISELLFSGPHNIITSVTSGGGQFILRWTPSEDEDGESHPICFVVQAVSNSVKYHSELRCVIVSVGNGPTVTTTIRPTTTPVATTTITIPTTTTTQSTTTITTPTTSTPQNTTNIPPATTPLTINGTTATTATQNTTDISPTTTPLTINGTTPTTATQNTTHISPTTTPLTVNGTTPTTTTTPNTTDIPSTTTPLTVNGTTPTTATQNTTDIPSTTTPLTVNGTTPTTATQNTTDIPSTTTPLTINGTTPTTATQNTTDIPPTTTPLTINGTTPNTATQNTTDIPPTTTLLTINGTTPTTATQNTTNIPPTTTLLTINGTTPITATQNTTNIPPTTTPLTINGTTPTTATQNTTDIPSTTTQLTLNGTTPNTATQNTTDIPPTTTPLTINGTTPTTATQNTTDIPSTTTPRTTTITTPTSTVPSTTTTPTTTASPPPITTPVTQDPNPTNHILVALRMKLSSLTPLSEDDIRNTVIQQIRDELVRRGLPSDVTLSLVSVDRIN